MKLHSFLLVSFLGFLADPVTGTWSIIATDRATGQVGGAGATCRGASGGDSLLEDDFGSGVERGVLVGQASASHSNVELAEGYLQDGETPYQILNDHDNDYSRSPYTLNEQWAVVDLDGNVEATPCSSCSSEFLQVQGQIGKDITYSAQGNRLSSKNVIYNAEKEFKKKGKGKRGGKGKGSCHDLADRLMRAMEASSVDEDGNIMGDTDCTPSTPANTAYLLVKKPGDDEDDP